MSQALQYTARVACHCNNYKHWDSAHLRQGTSVVGWWRNDIIVAMVMPASAWPALQRRAAQSVDTTFHISQ